MTQPGAMLYTQGFGSRPENVEVPVIVDRIPSSYDVNYPVGKVWVYPNGNACYILTSLSSSQGIVSANWQVLGSPTAAVQQLTGDTGTAIPSSGSITVAGGSNLTSSATGSTVTIDLDSSVSGLTSLSSTTVSAGKVNVTAGANAAIGQAVLVAGTKTVSTNKVTTNSIIFVTVATLGTVTAPQAMLVSNIVNGVSFDITSADGTDTSTVNWLIIN